MISLGSNVDISVIDEGIGSASFLFFPVCHSMRYERFFVLQGRHGTNGSE
jgi:hypothetical protein